MLRSGHGAGNDNVRLSRAHRGCFTVQRSLHHRLFQPFWGGGSKK